MDKKTKIFVGVVLTFFVGVLIWAFSGTPEVPSQTAEPVEPQAMSYVGNTIVEEKNGRKVWEVMSETIEIDSQTNNTVLKNVKGLFYQESGEVIELTAPEGIYDTKHQTVQFVKGVDAKASDGSSFRADSARWDSAKKLFQAEGAVKVVKEDAVLTGDRLDSDASFENVKVSGNARIVKGGNQ